MDKIGIFGGSFDPIHIGHLIMADTFFYQFNLNKLLFIPSYQSPLKNTAKIVSIEKNKELLGLAISYNKHYILEDYELTKKEISYTIDTIEYLLNKYNAELYLLIGDDQFFQFQKWKNWESILNNITLVVARRNCIDYISINKEIQLYKEMGFNVFALEAPFIEISSTYIRNCIQNSLPFKNLIPENLYNKILEEQLYQ
ncbi:MAG TPA: nicotinate (nicotinamide) nucleotide adenylyltransferase [Candidatus Kapabacteria bacterium]|nr:nicotinate (nicotinamide) nucleotide adenylyltransferase [Candidatus Kapabacteria bacterium]